MDTKIGKPPLSLKKKINSRSDQKLIRIARSMLKNIEKLTNNRPKSNQDKIEYQNYNDNSRPKVYKTVFKNNKFINIDSEEIEKSSNRSFNTHHSNHDLGKSTINMK